MPRTGLAPVTAKWEERKAQGDWNGVLPRVPPGLSCAGQFPKAVNEPAERGENPLIPFPKEGGEDVLADLLPPEMVTAVAARQVRGEQVHPMVVDAAGDPVPPGADTNGLELEAALETGQVDGNSGEIDGGCVHSGLAFYRYPNITRSLGLVTLAKSLGSHELSP
jgi:hypothetical protein